MDRIACALIPRYELALRARADPSVWKRPVAVADLATRPARIAALSEVAETLGVRVGQLVSNARALVPELTLLAPDPDCHQATERELLLLLATLSPELDSDGHGAFFLSLSGLGRLIESEPAFAERIFATLNEAGFSARVAIADEPFVAWACAQGTRTIEIIQAGRSADRLAQIPLSALGLPEPALELLLLLGIRTAGELVSLPAGALSRRLGAQGAHIERLCRGESHFAWPSSQNIPQTELLATLELDEPIGELEPLLFLTKTLLDRLLRELARQGQALAELTMKVRLDDRSQVIHRITPHRPTLETPLLLDLVRLWLDTRPLASSISALTAIASRVGQANTRQLGLFLRQQEAEADALDRAVARLGSAFGPEQVVRPTLGESFRPEARLRWLPFAARPSESAAPAAVGRKKRMTEHIGRLQSACAQKVAGEPVRFVLRLLPRPEPIQWHKGEPLRRAGQSPTRVVVVQGPHRVAGEWWDHPFDRSYYWLTLADGALLWVFRDEQDGTFHLQGVAD